MEESVRECECPFEPSKGIIIAGFLEKVTYFSPTRRLGFLSNETLRREWAMLGCEAVNHWLHRGEEHRSFRDTSLNSSTLSDF